MTYTDPLLPPTPSTGPFATEAAARAAGKSLPANWRFCGAWECRAEGHEGWHIMIKEVLSKEEKDRRIALYHANDGTHPTNLYAKEGR